MILLVDVVVVTDVVAIWKTCFNFVEILKSLTCRTGWSCCWRLNKIDCSNHVKLERSSFLSFDRKKLLLDSFRRRTIYSDILDYTQYRMFQKSNVKVNSYCFIIRQSESGYGWIWQIMPKDIIFRWNTKNTFFRILLKNQLFFFFWSFHFCGIVRVL